MKKIRTAADDRRSQPGLFESVTQDRIPESLVENSATCISVMALSSITGVGHKTVQAIYDLGVINRIWKLEHTELKRILASIGRKTLDLAEIIARQREKLFEQGRRRAEGLAGRGISFIPSNSEGYPQALRAIREYPRWLFVLGDTEVLSAKAIVAIVGSREASPGGSAAAYGLARAFVVKNIVVLSGLADGIDQSAHRAAVDYYGQTIGVLGHGFDARYAARDTNLWTDIVRRDGAVVTEYLPDESPSRENFLRRNELQVAMSNLVVPVEVPDLASGTGATIRRALNLKKTIMGIEVDGRDNQASKKTVSNLRSLDIPVFRLPSQLDAMWQFVRSTMPRHDMSPNSRPRQERFARILFGEAMVMVDFLEEMKRASFSDADVDWLANEIKTRLQSDDQASRL